jgi:GDPmannose 4,6-dehydratase
MSVALITGVLGQDGGYLADLLRERGYRVVGLDLVSPSVPLPGVEHVSGNVCDPAVLSDLFARTRPAEVYHLAGQTSVARSFAEPAATFRGMTEGTLNVLEAARSLSPSPRVLVAGSGEVFGDTNGEAATEATPLRPCSPYGAAKAAVAHLAATYRRSFGLFVCVAHFYNHESPRRPAHFVTQKIVRSACRIAAGLEQRLELGDTSVVRDFGWAPEYVDAATRMLAASEPHDLLIATGQSCSLQQFVEAAFEAVGLVAREHVSHQPALLRAAEIPVMRVDPARAEAVLGWRAQVRWRELVERLVAAEQARAATPAG